MPTLTLGDGSTLSWGDPAPTTMALTASDVPPDTAVPQAVEPPAPMEQPVTEEQPTVTEADVSAALAKVPPKWSAAAWRFLKTLGAGLAAAFVVAGGSVEAIVKDPTAFLTAVGAAVVMAVQKFISWKD